MAARKLARFTPPPVCPVCGEDVPRNALACPECGADERSGWRADAEAYDGVGLPDDFDYDGFVRDEFGSRVKPKGISVFWWLAAIAVIVALSIAMVHRGGL